jgi:hypothetical protein
MADSLAEPQCRKSFPCLLIPPMSVNSSRSRAAASPVLAALLPIIAVVFIAYLVIGIAPCTPATASRRSRSRRR